MTAINPVDVFHGKLDPRVRGDEGVISLSNKCVHSNEMPNFKFNFMYLNNLYSHVNLINPQILRKSQIYTWTNIFY